MLPLSMMACRKHIMDAFEDKRTYLFDHDVALMLDYASSSWD
jgi:hypothetical protein